MAQSRFKQLENFGFSVNKAIHVGEVERVGHEHEVTVQFAGESQFSEYSAFGQLSPNEGRIIANQFRFVERGRLVGHIENLYGPTQYLSFRSHHRKFSSSEEIPLEEYLHAMRMNWAIVVSWDHEFFRWEIVQTNVSEIEITDEVCEVHTRHFVIRNMNTIAD